MRSHKNFIAVATVFSFLGFILLLGFSILFLLHHSLNIKTSIDSTEFSNYGSFIGGLVGSLWSFAGVIFFYVALKYQQEELTLQRDELKLQRAEMEMTREVMKEQTEIFSIQRFETSFINLVKSFIETSAALEERPTLIQYTRDSKAEIVRSTAQAAREKGKALFNATYQCFRDSYSNVLNIQIPIHEEFPELFTSNEIETERINDRRKTRILKGLGAEFFNVNRGFLSSYFNVFFTILELIKSQKSKDTVFYVNILRAHLSKAEQCLIFYYCLCTHGETEFATLNELNFFNSAIFTDLLDIFHVRLYPSLVGNDST